MDYHAATGWARPRAPLRTKLRVYAICEETVTLTDLPLRPRNSAKQCMVCFCNFLVFGEHSAADSVRFMRILKTDEKF